MNNGYLITYFKGQKWIDQDQLLSKQDVEDHVQVAMEIEECDLVTVHCIDNGEVMYVEEMFRVDGKWVLFTSNNIMNTHTMATL